MAPGVPAAVPEQAGTHFPGGDLGTRAGSPEIGHHLDGGHGATGPAFVCGDVVGRIQLPDVRHGPRRPATIRKVAEHGVLGVHEAGVWPQTAGFSRSEYDRFRTHPMRLSIVTVCKNESDRIGRTAASIGIQAGGGFEWIVVDGGSADGTLETLERTGVRPARWTTGPDEGIYDAMNRGVGMAQGEYLLFLNAGDVLAGPGTVLAFLGADVAADLGVGGLTVVYRDGTVQHRPAAPEELGMERLYWRSFPHPATFIRRDLFARMGLYDRSFRVAADWEFFARSVRGGASVQALEFDVAVFTNDGFSADPANRGLLRRETARIRRRHYPAAYRWRRDLNEGWGRLVQRWRHVVRPGRWP